MIAAVLIAVVTLTPTSSSNFDWVCPTLDRNPTVDGMWDVIYGGVARGQTNDYAASQIVAQVRDVCPEYIPIALAWADAND